MVDGAKEVIDTFAFKPKHTSRLQPSVKHNTAVHINTFLITVITDVKGIIQQVEKRYNLHSCHYPK